ncbi:MAG: RNA-binding S4 domain-containing protein [Sulfurospirillaceae bacterium]|nr:RNA-binding S4 domain-containing protein [Sulfurospirillaceae bacterium]MDD2827175.1 RNA-binding S4 domain-containing protein [Sulfurospirillaceae bacterium]
MKFELKDDYIELFKLIKVMGLVESGAQAKMLIDDGQVTRNGEVELRKRCKVVAGETIEVAGDIIEVEATLIHGETLNKL